MDAIINTTFADKHLHGHKMKATDLTMAVDVVANSESCKVAFNVPVEANYSNCYQLLLLEANASTINKLIALGFSLTMTSKGLAVDKFCI